MAAPGSRLLPVALFVALLVSPPLGMVALWTAVQAKTGTEPSTDARAWRWVVAALVFVVAESALFGAVEVAAWLRGLWERGL